MEHRDPAKSRKAAGRQTPPASKHRPSQGEPSQNAHDDVAADLELQNPELQGAEDEDEDVWDVAPCDSNASLPELGDRGELDLASSHPEAVSARAVSPEAVSPEAAIPEAAIPEARILEETVEEDASVGEEPHPHVARRRFWLTAVPSWLISLVVHVILIVVLAAISIEPIQRAISILRASSGDAADAIEKFDLQAPSIDVSDALDEPLSVPTPQVSEIVEMPPMASPLMPSMETPLEALAMNRMTESIMPSSMLNSAAMAQMATALNSRSAARKSEMLERFGGNAASEKAVAMALKWLADHQASNGGWTFAHNKVCRDQCDRPGDLAFATNGATAMALLPFLGAGQTHLEGQYKQTVHRGLSYLINRMQVTAGALPKGSWHEPGGRMYSHGLAAITVCEAYAMTRDPDLLQPAQLSLNYLVDAQDKRGGGWRYEPGQPGDTSVVGWCIMALKSGKMGNLKVPSSTFQGTQQFLDFVSVNNGAYYGYDKPTSKIQGREGTIAVGLLCRMYLGWPKEHPGLNQGIEYLDKVGPRMNNLYYSYYATQVMRHHGGAEWEKWNTKMRDDLTAAQEQQGHAAGSWRPEGSHSDKGGRLYQTSLATMILEVYYRHMPLYSEKSAADDFEI